MTPACRTKAHRTEGHVRSEPSVFRGRIKALIFRRSFPWVGDSHRNICRACAVTVGIFGHVNRSFYLLTFKGEATNVDHRWSNESHIVYYLLIIYNSRFCHAMYSAKMLPTLRIAKCGLTGSRADREPRRGAGVDGIRSRELGGQSVGGPGESGTVVADRPWRLHLDCLFTSRRVGRPSLLRCLELTDMAVGRGGDRTSGELQEKNTAK